MSRRDSTSGWLIPVAILVVAAAALLRVAGLGREPWLDEAITLRVVNAEDWREWALAVSADSPPPLYPGLLTLWAAIDDSLPWLRLLSLLAGVATIAVAMCWASASSGLATIVTGVLLATGPFVLRYSVELRPYALLGLATAWAGLAASRAARRPGEGDGWSVGVPLAMAAVSHPTGVLFIPAAIAVIVTASLVGEDRPGWRERMKRVPWHALAIVSLLGGATLVAELMVAQPFAVGPFHDDWWMPPLSPSLVLHGLGEVLGLAGDVGTSPVRFAALALAVTALFGAAWGARRDWLPPVTAALAFWLTVAAVSVVWRPIWWPRILLPGLAPMVVAVAVAAAGLPRTALRVVVVAALLTAAGANASLWLAGGAYEAPEPWRDAVADLDPASGRFPVICVPQYVEVVLREALSVDPSRLVAVEMEFDEQGLAERLMPAIRSASEGEPVGLAVRIDLTLSSDPALPARIARRIGAGASRPFVLHVALVLSPDVRMVPALARGVDEVQAHLQAALGMPASQMDRRGSRRLAFHVTGEAAR